MPDHKERPILFSGEMVRAILNGRKTQTRRAVKSPYSSDGPFQWVSTPEGFYGCLDLSGDGFDVDGKPQVFACPYGVPGDRLWVRETWADTNGESGPMISYKAGGDRFLIDDSSPVDYSRYPGCQFTMWCGDLRRGAPGHSWRPSIHMPRWASRITLEVTDVRVQRLQDISEEDAEAEGAICAYKNNEPQSYIDAFHALWDSLNAKRSFGWDADPWVWVITFRRTEND